MDFKQLRTFVLVAEHLHFGLAAEQLRIAQPQVSRRITQLEEELDVVLFDRSSRVVRLTNAGRAFLKEAIALIKAADTARVRVRDSARGQEGLLTISLIDAALLGAVPTILKEYHKRFPNVYLSFKNHGISSSGQLESLNDGSSDIVFTHPPNRLIGDFDQILLVSDPMVAVLPQQHRLAREEKINLIELAQDPWVMFPRENDPSIYDRIIVLCQRAGFSPRIVQETGHMLTRLGLVASGFGVHLVHRAWETMPYPGVVYIPVEPTASIGVSCFWRRGDDSILLRNFLEIARLHKV
ncbi:MAG: LysR family transcriptional regulator [Devosia sp.]|jgi:DNA-binding transcriptional LysR family regulator|nr:LysR family transcriptional regulator [Devosiaceae bacterium]